MHQAETVTGVLLMYPGYAVHLVETSSDIMYGILRDLHKNELAGRPLVSETKILAISHDIPSR